MGERDSGDPFWQLIDLDPDVIDADPAEYIRLGPQQLPGNCIVPAKTISRSI